MTSRNTGGPTKNAAPLLATFFTFLYALVPCLIIIVAGTGASASAADLSFIAAVILGVITFFWLLKRLIPPHINDGSFLALRARRTDPLGGYEPRKKGRRRRKPYGTQKPATVDEIREIRAEASKSVWVPRSKSNSD